MHIELSVSGQRLRREMGPGIVGGSRYYLTAHVAFAGHDWDSCQVWLRIDKDGAQNAYLLDADGCVTADRGINLPAGQYTMSLLGLRDNVRITTNVVPLCVLQSGADGGDPLPEIPQTAAEQIALLAQEAVDTARSVREDADAGDFNGAPGKDGVSAEHQWDGSVLTITSASGTSSADLRGPQGPQGPEGPEGKQGPQGPEGQAGKDAPQDAVRYGVQALDEAQQAIARDNIGAASAKEVSRVKDDLDKLNEGGLNLKDAIIEEDINNWLNEHPEATTTVQDGSLTKDKFKEGVLAYVTPEMFGAVGNGTDDDSTSINNAIAFINGNNYTKTLVLLNKTYAIYHPIDLTGCESVKIISSTESQVKTNNAFIKCNCDDAFILDATKYCYFADITIWCNKDKKNGIHYKDTNIDTGASRCFSNRFENITLFGFENSVKIDTGTGYDTFNNCTFGNGHTCVDIGVDYVSKTGKISPNYIYFYGCKFSACDICIDLGNDTQYIYVNKCDFVDGIGINATKTSVKELIVTENVFFSCIYPIYATVTITSSVICNNIIMLNSKDNSGNAIDPNGIYIAPESGSCSNLKIDNIFKINYSGYSKPLIYVSSANGYYADCSYPYNYPTTVIPIDGDRPDNYRELLSRSATTQTTKNGIQDHSVTLKLWYKPRYYKLSRIVDGGAGYPAGMPVRIISPSLDGRILSYRTNEETSISCLLECIY